MNGEKIEQIIREKIQTYQQQEISLTQNIYRVKGAVKATADGKVTAKERSALMTEFWDIINTAKAIRK